MPTKDWYASSTVWGGILAVVAPIAGSLLHREIDSDLINQLSVALAAIGGVVAIIGRMRATTVIQAPAKETK